MKSLFTVAILTLGLSAQAQIRMGVPAYGGNGCVPGSASVSVSNDQSALSILFDSFVAQAPTADGKLLDRKFCNLRIPVKIAPGYQLAIVLNDIQGFASVPQGGRGQLQARFGVMGEARPLLLNKNFVQGVADNYSLKNELISTSTHWSACSSGADMFFNIDLNITAVTSAKKEQVVVTVEPSLESPLILGFQYRRCK